MKHKIPLKTGDEYDALTPWRKIHRFRAGQVKRIKRSYNKRFRRYMKRCLVKPQHDTQGMME